MRKTIKARCTPVVNVISNTKVKRIFVITQESYMKVSDTPVQYVTGSIPHLGASDNILKQIMRGKNIFVKNVKNPLIGKDP